MNNFTQLTDWLGVGTPPAEWQAISNQPLLILVGLTGVGKTTTINALVKAGVTFQLLPDRRILTDRLIFPAVQQAMGEPIAPITDRIQRFEYTRRYRELHPEGMVYALSQLKVSTMVDTLLLFDGLRGVNEVSSAVTLLPSARFLVLTAPNFVRVQRLLGRGDAFDQVALALPTEEGNSFATLGISGVEGLFSAEEERYLFGLVNLGEISLETLIAKVKIVATEAQNYDTDATVHALQALAPERMILIDTTKLQPEESAAIVREQLARE